MDAFIIIMKNHKRKPSIWKCERQMGDNMRMDPGELSMREVEMALDRVQ